MSNLTGRYRFRKSLFGKLVLQVEYEKFYMNDLNGSGYYDEYYTRHWRDATEKDIMPQIPTEAHTMRSFSLVSQIPAKG